MRRLYLAFGAIMLLTVNKKYFVKHFAFSSLTRNSFEVDCLLLNRHFLPALGSITRVVMILGGRNWAQSGIQIQTDDLSSNENATRNRQFGYSGQNFSEKARFERDSIQQISSAIAPGAFRLVVRHKSDA